MSVAHDLVILAFSVTNACRIVAYMPQIVRLTLDRSGSSGVSCATWSLFFISNAATAAYAAIVLRDSWMAIIFTANTVSCFTIVALTLSSRRASSKEQQQRSVKDARWHPKRICAIASFRSTDGIR